MSLPTLVIACGVFERELDALRQAHPGAFEVVMLDAGLHSRPRELKARVQEVLDEADPARFGRAALLYGLCGRGAVGLISRDIPLVIPRVHDCVALFLGDADEYRRQFAACPGTFYMTPGWFEKKTHPDAWRVRAVEGGMRPEDDPHFDGWALQYGRKNAAMIVEFFQSWRKNYRRVVFLNNGLGETDRYREYVRLMADAAHWEFEEIPTSIDFVQSAVCGPHDEERFLVAPPRHMVIATNDTRVFAAVPADPSEQDVLNVKRALSGVRLGRFTVEGPARPERPRHGVGLGIDAGGTYTDAVLLDLASGDVLAKAKAPTTPQDLSIGVENAVAALDADALASANLVALSTTLATNAVVEHRGAHVGLILMPPGAPAPDDVQAHPFRVVPGRMTIDGTPTEAVDPEAVRRAAREMLAEGVEAFAVSGYAGVHNPAHERAVRAVIHEVCDLPVVCGHELSAQLNFLRRAHTAVLNARLIPVIDELLVAVRGVLVQRGVQAPLFVVRGDGSLLEMAAASERAIETVLSGPAASAAGACFLTGAENVIAVDVGGTTTDVAVVTDGRLSVCDDGATVGRWHTSVTAADILTTGLGGDSYVRLREGGRKLTVGPERVAPLSFVAREHPHVATQLASLAEESRHEAFDAGSVEFFQFVRVRPGLSLTERETAIVKALRDGPVSRDRLARRIGVVSPLLLPTRKLEERGVVRRCAFTPTDALHVTGGFTRYDAEAARSAAAVLGRLADKTPEEFAAWTCDEFTRRLAYEIMRRELALAVGDPSEQQNEMLQAVLGGMLDEPTDESPFTVRFHERRTVVGIGAPAAAFLPAAGRRVHAEVVVPEHAEVANAIGAVTGKVIVRETVRIRPDASGGYILVGPLGRDEFGRLRDAQQAAAEQLTGYLRRRAEEFGTDARDVLVEVNERSGRLEDGSDQFLELVVSGTLEGAPRAGG